MKHQRFYKYIFFLSILIFVCTNCMSQKPVKNFNDSLSKTAYIINNGDSVAVQIDSTVIMNKTTFHLYQIYYDKGRFANSSYKLVLNSYEDIIRKQDSMLAEKEFYYKLLNTNYESFSGNTMHFIDSTRSELKIISKSLDSAQSHLFVTQKALNEAQKEIADERRKSSFRAFKFGFAGLLIGGLLAAVIIH